MPASRTRIAACSEPSSSAGEHRRPRVLCTASSRLACRRGRAARRRGTRNGCSHAPGAADLCRYGRTQRSVPERRGTGTARALGLRRHPRRPGAERRRALRRAVVWDLVGPSGDRCALTTARDVSVGAGGVSSAESRTGALHRSADGDPLQTREWAGRPGGGPDLSCAGRAELLRAACQRTGAQCQLLQVQRRRRSPLAEGPVEVASGRWHTLRLEVRGTEFRGYLDDRQVVSASDATFPAGQVGLWTKADAHTCFDDVEVRPLCEELRS
jgi:hypothetical protein